MSLFSGVTGGGAVVTGGIAKVQPWQLTWGLQKAGVACAPCKSTTISNTVGQNGWTRWSTGGQGKKARVGARDGGKRV